MQDVVICGSKQTPMGALGGSLMPKTAPQLGALPISASLADIGIKPDLVDEALMGIVLPAGVGQAPARQAGLVGGLPQSVPCTAVSKVCGSGMQAVRQAFAQISAGFSGVVVAGGMESMSNAPYASSKAGVAGLTLPMARDLAKSGVRVAAIAPGLFATPMVTAFPKEVQDALAQTSEFPKRLGNTEEFACLVQHIVTNPMLNGSVIRLDAATRMQAS